MEKQIYYALAKAGNRYWWNQGRQYLVTKLFERYSQGGLCSSKNLKILDIGCAAGGTLFYLAKWGEVWGLDISPGAIALCRSWGIDENHLVLGNAEEMPNFSDQQFDLVTAVEILEHLEHPEQALKEIWRILKPKGVLIITVPADKRLWSDRDERLGHRLRYTVESLVENVQQANFSVLKASYTNFFYYWPYRLILWLRRRFQKSRVPKIKTDTYDVNFLFNWLFVWLLKLETWIILQCKLPWGVSAVCVAQKNAASDAAENYRAQG